MEAYLLVKSIRIWIHVSKSTYGGLSFCMEELWKVVLLQEVESGDPYPQGFFFAQFHWSRHISSMPYFALCIGTFIVELKYWWLRCKEIKSYLQPTQAITYFHLSSFSAFLVDAYKISASPGRLPALTTGIFWEDLNVKSCRRRNIANSRLSRAAYIISWNHP